MTISLFDVKEKNDIAHELRNRVRAKIKLFRKKASKIDVSNETIVLYKEIWELYEVYKTALSTSNAYMFFYFQNESLNSFK